ncbi:MAG: hypothetical protein RMK29_00485 [Myxococcales bacterium]|nr:hypothetical protein [Myxococcota bacterium]MDW8280153.1 hypothetical protein [Myxococcales bacterium]
MGFTLVWQAVRLALLLPLLLLAPPTRGQVEGPQHELLRGVRAFRAERYEEALAIFRRLEAQGEVREIGFYVGTTLHKLGRHEEALGAFRAAARAGLREPVAAYYQALSCYRLGMLQRARLGFASLVQGEASPGPRLREGARRFLQHIEAALPGLPPGPRYAAVLAHAQAMLPGHEAIEWLEEAVLLLPYLPDRRVAAERVRALLERLPPGEDATALLRALDTGP